MPVWSGVGFGRWSAFCGADDDEGADEGSDEEVDESEDGRGESTGVSWGDEGASRPSLTLAVLSAITEVSDHSVLQPLRMMHFKQTDEPRKLV